MTTEDFNGAKLAILCDGRVLALHRDDIPTIVYPGLWDLPGGGREGDESPDDCALRETWEETGIVLDPALINWRRVFPHPRKPGGRPVWLMVAVVAPGVLPAPRLGDEGQALDWMPVDTFLTRPDVIPFLKTQLAVYFDEVSS